MNENARLTLYARGGRRYTIPLGDGPVVPTAGGAVFEETARPEKTALTDYTGNELIRLDVPCFVDGWPRESVAQQVTNIMGLCRGQDGEEPTPFIARGPMPFEGIRYVMEFPDVLSQQRRHDGTLVRWEATLHFVQYVRPDIVKVRRVRPTTKIIVLKRKMSCIEIASIYLHDPSRGKEVAKLNGIRDPRKKLDVGTRVTIPLMLKGIGQAQAVG